MTNITVLAIDLGAESGRVAAVAYDGQRLQMEELHRFANGPLTENNTLYWDIQRLWREIQTGIAKGHERSPAALGVDTWAIDFGLLDAQGQLLGNPVHYRDRRTEGVYERVQEQLGREAIFAATGIQFLQINTLYQLASLAEQGDPHLQAAATFLTIPDLLNYWLTGERVCEFTNATTTQCYNTAAGRWANELLEPLGIPTAMFPKVIAPGTRLGNYHTIPVIAPACHDTGSAVAAVPALNEASAYISSGTWSLVGLEIPAPIISPAALAANVTNEGGVYGTNRLLKNVMGLWIVQQCRATWVNSGSLYSYDELATMAEQAMPLVALIDPDDKRFLAPGDHPLHIAAYCAETGQPVPTGHGGIIRAVYESLALAYRATLEQLAALTGRTIRTLHIVGGGSQNALLCQMTADATGTPVIAGPVEATVLGNAIVQLISLGEINHLQEARELLARSGELRRYEPRPTADWDAAYRRFVDMRNAGAQNDGSRSTE
jgi:rhamnulokinase